MNKKGFTLVELLATLVILGIVVSISIFSINNLFNNAKDKSEDVFIGTIKDAMEVYLSSNAKDLDFTYTCSNKLNKSFGDRIVYRTEINFSEVINSRYKPITEDDLVNPANKDVDCVIPNSIYIYKDEDFVYYYSIDMDDFLCFKGSGYIKNLPEGYECGL